MVLGFGFGDFCVRLDWFGWVGGVGVEMMLLIFNWIGCIEYLYYDFGVVECVQSFVISDFVEINYVGSVGCQIIDIIRIGLFYKFGLFQVYFLLVIGKGWFRGYVCV